MKQPKHRTSQTYQQPKVKAPTGKAKVMKAKKGY